MHLSQLCKIRHIARRAIEGFFDGLGYTSVDAPILVCSPGTEVYLDYFESSWLDVKHGRHTMFLRSSPEIHLKQALSYDLEKIYHLGKVFRNGGELAEWHHPEFTMLEWYEAGIDFFDYMQQTQSLIEAVYYALHKADLGLNLIALPERFHRLSVFEAFERYAGITLIDQDEDLAKKALDKGFISVRADDDFETAYFKILLDVIEPRLKALGAVFLYDYPASQAALSQVIDGKAKRFELYLNGIELCNAFFELLNPLDNQKRIVEANEKRRLLNKQPVPLDQEFMGALSRGIPECCGNALGFDRLLASLLQLPGIDSVIAFRTMQPYGDLSRS
jgi:lysyl-tRNA synthetase class 2